MRKTVLLLPLLGLLFACKQDAAPTKPTASASPSASTTTQAPASAAAASSVPSSAPVASGARAPGAAHARGCTVVGKLPKWRYGLAVAEVMEKSPVGEKVLVIGGHQHDSGSELADVDIYDVNTKTFSPGKPLPAPRAGHVATSGFEFKSVIVAGGNQKSVDVWDLDKKAWRSIGSLESAPLYSIGVCQHIGTTLLAGGDRQYKGALSAAAYLVTPEKLTRIADLPAPRIPTFVTGASKSEFAVLGGGPDLAYDEKAKQWKPVAADDAIVKIFKAPSYPKGEMIYATYQHVATTDAVYQRSTGDEWVKVPTQKNHAGGAAVSLGGGMFVVGGINEDAASAEFCTF